MTQFARFGFWLLALPFLLMESSGAIAQSITPAADGTNTRITINGSTYEIRGGQLSRDGANLFHSFQQFGLSAGEVAEFLANPQVQNILGRVTGGNASRIDGLLRLSGSNANLYLMNPAGVIFGPNARLDLPASFTTTTATGIGLTGGWFSATGENAYTSLVGTPTTFAFTAAQSGAILNAGTLTVQPGADLTLLGGTVVNTGSVSAPGGTITLTAVPGQNLVRLSQTGFALSLEFEPLPPQGAAALPQPWTMAIAQLPQLLTGGDVQNATSVAVNPDGTIRLTGSGLSAPATPGTTLVGGTVDASSTRGTGGRVNIVGQQVGVLDATVRADGDSGGGQILVGGDYRGSGSIPNAETTVVSAGTVISADARSNGNGGRAIVWADGFTRFLGSISAQGGQQAGNGGFIEVSGRETLDFRGNATTQAPNGQVGTLLLDPENIEIVPGPSAPADSLLTDGSIFASEFPGQTLRISEGFLENLTQFNNVTLEATNNIRILDLPDNELVFLGFAPRQIRFIADADNDGVGNFSMNPFDTIDTRGSNLTIRGANLSLGTIVTSSPGDSGGNLTLTATQNITVRGGIVATGVEGRGGAITITAGGTVRIGSLPEDGGSILAFGASGPGSITIRHGGSSFTVGDVGASSWAASSLETGLPFNEGFDGGDFLSDRVLTSNFISPNGTIRILRNVPQRPPRPERPTIPATNEEFQDYEDRPQPPLDPLDLGDDFEPGEDLGDAGDFVNDTEISQATDAQFMEMEDSLSSEFEDYLGLAEEAIPSMEQATTQLNRIAQQTGINPALVYISFTPEQIATGSRVKRDTDTLELVLVSGQDSPIRVRVGNVTRKQVLDMARQLVAQITDRRRLGSTTYLGPARQLYQWLIAPLETELQNRKIGNIAFITESGLRSLPLAALHDGQQFLVERYSIGLMPSLSLTDALYSDIRDVDVLAMGADQFQDLTPLPAVPTELQAIANDLWQGESFLNQEFTVSTLIRKRQQQPFGIVHLATHGEFKPGVPANSFIQFWDSRVGLNDLRQLQLNNPPVQLLVLSACRTALGDEQAELGFAGLAVQAGVRTALASLWYVSDEGTLGFMTEFYRQLRTAPIKAEALRRTQMAMIQGEIRLQGGALRSARGSVIELPPQVDAGDRTLTHPYFWAAFTMIGSPW